MDEKRFAVDDTRALRYLNGDSLVEKFNEFSELNTMLPCTLRRVDSLSGTERGVTV